MSCMDEETIEETLTKLHEQKCQEMVALNQLYDYLMDSMQYLKTIDLEGWKTRFLPEPPPTANKRLKMSPNTVFVTPLPPCIECLEDNVIEDVVQGQMVCVSCGLIQSRVVSMEAHAHCSMDALKNRSRVYIHRYSRLSYFWTVLRLIQGETSPVITDVILSRLRAGIDGVPTGDKVKLCLRQMGLAKKYRRHRWSLARLLGGEAEYAWPSDVVLTMLKMFRKVEYYWNFYKKTVHTRMSFFSYPSLVYNFLCDMGLHPEQSLLLKSLELRRKQQELYVKLQSYIRERESLNKK